MFNSKLLVYRRVNMGKWDIHALLFVTLLKKPSELFEHLGPLF
jgi:hypothetical protein